MSDIYDVIVVGSGNAGFCAAHAARESGSAVLLLEKAPREWAGGNTYFTAGAMRLAHRGLDDLAGVIEPLPTDKHGHVTLDPYTADDFAADLLRITKGRTDPDLASVLVDESRDVIDWLRDKGLRFELMFHRQAYAVEGQWRFWGGLSVGVVDGGKGMFAQHLHAAQEAGIDIRFGAHVTDLVDKSGQITGVVVSSDDGVYEVHARAVVLASGGFEANPQMRAENLGAGWDLALVRGTPYNTGDGLRMALAHGAQPYGQWSGCHSVAWDAGARPTGDRELTNQLTRGGYPFGIVVNSDGDRFVDEGADYRNYTYAKYGAAVLRQPDGYAVQIFDAKVADLLRPEEYHAPGATRVEADTLAELAQQLGIDAGALSRTVADFNADISDRPFDPTVKDGKCAPTVTPPKSNWAQPIDTAPFVAYPVTCGITFTFGGLRTDTHGRVLDTAGRTIPGLYAAGEALGGLFWFNYPGGSGLTAGSVFGRRAGYATTSDLLDNRHILPEGV